MSEVTPKPRKAQNGTKQQNAKGGGKGGTAPKSGGVPRDQLTPQQRHGLKEVRNVIKDQATDEQILSMLVDHNNDSKQVIRHIVENGADDGWSDVSSKSKKRRDAEDSVRDRGSRGKGNSGRGRDDATGRANEGRVSTRPTPKAAPSPKLPHPAPAPPAPALPVQTHATAPAPVGKSWASLARGAEDPMPHDIPQPMHPFNADDQETGPPLFASMMQAAREGEMQSDGWGKDDEKEAIDDSMPAPAPLPVPTPKPVMQEPLPAPTPTPSTNLLESLVTTQSAPAIVGAETCLDQRHQRNFLSNLLSLWDQRLLCDLRLIPTAENKPNNICIRVHSAVIAAQSAEIQKILVDCVSTNGTIPPDLVVHVETNALEELVRYMYTGDLRIHDESVRNIMHAAQTLGVISATDLCVQFLGRNITSVNALSVSDMAITFNRPELKTAVEGYLLKNIQGLVQESDFLQQPVERVTELLSSDEANFQSEVDVFHAVVRWVRHDVKNRGPIFATLMSETVRLPLLTPEQLLDDVEGEELVRSDRAAQSLVFETYRYQALPESRRDTMEIRGTRVRLVNLQTPFY